MKEIQLTRGCVALVDDEDFDVLNCHKWYTSINGYAVREVAVIDASGNKKSRMALMHREVLGTPDGLETDHKNGQKLDNRKCNLRMATFSENCRNKGADKRNKLRLKGVWLRKNRKTYCAQIRVNNQRIRLGDFPTAKAAYAAYCEAAKRLHGEFCPTFIETTSHQLVACSL